MESKTTQSTNFLNIFSRKFSSKRIGNFATLFLTICLTLAMSSSGWAQTVIPATDGGSIQYGSYYTLTGPTITETTDQQLATSGTIILNAPSGFSFDIAGAAPTVTISNAGSGTTNLTASFTSRTSSSITYTITSKSSGANKQGKLTFGSIRVTASSASPLSSGYITNTGTTGPSGTTKYGTLTQIAGCTALAPTALTYSSNIVTYCANVAISSNSPSNSGGAPISYSVSPALPTGLSLNTSTGVITGTPTTATVAADYTVTATNSCGNTTKAVNITVSPAAPTALTYTSNTVTYCANIAITSNSPSNSGGALTSYSVSPALPTGLSLNTSTGVITGTPTTANAATDYTVTATNSCGNTTKAVNITVNALPAITTQPLPQTKTYGEDASFTVVASNTTGYQWEVSTNGGGAWSPIANGGVYSTVTTATLNITKPTVAMSTYQYRCVVTNSCGSATSDGLATLKVNALGITGNFTVDATKVYDGGTLSNVLTRTLNGVISPDVVILDGGTANYDNKNVANGKTVTLTGMTLSGAQAGNYSLTSVATTTADITAKSLTASTTVTKVYDGTTSVGIATLGTVIGLIGSETLSITPTHTTLYSSANVGNAYAATVSYALANGTGLAANYSMADLVINSAAITAYQVTSSVIVSSPVHYSDQATFTARIVGGAPLVVGGPQAAGSVTFKVGTQVMGTVSFEEYDNDLVATGTYALLEGIAGQMAPSTTAKTVTAEINSPDANFSISPSSPTTSLTITKENAVVNYIGTEITATQSITNLSANLDLRVSVQDIGDGYRGDITKATVQFKIDGEQIMAPTLISQLVDSYTGIISKAWPVNLAINNPSATYTLEVIVGGYYQEILQTVITVYVPTGDFITGGGHIIPTASVGTYPSDTGTKTNFGFNVKFNKKGTNLQGKLNFIWRSGGKVYQAKSNATLSLGVDINSPNAQIATFSSKCNLVDITDPLNPISKGGNMVMNVNMTDKGEPGVNDDIAFTLWDGNKLMYSSNWNGTNTLKMLLNGGNLVVHSGFNSGAITTNTVQTSNNTSVKAAQSSEVDTDLLLFNVTAYPNPSADYFTLKLQAIQSEEFNKVEINVFDVLGRQVYRAQGNKEDSYEFGQNFQVGVYLVTVKQGNNTASLKVIKK